MDRTPTKVNSILPNRTDGALFGWLCDDNVTSKIVTIC